VLCFPSLGCPLTISVVINVRFCCLFQYGLRNNVTRQKHQDVFKTSASVYSNINNVTSLNTSSFYEFHFKLLQSSVGTTFFTGDTESRAVEGVGVRPLACWDCGFEFLRGIDACLLWVLCVVR
jgi:hypothetical protein